MKKIIVLVIYLFYSICLIGCNNVEDEKVIVEFIIEDISHNVEIDKGSKLVEEMVPIKVKNESIELYYDKNFTNNYADEQIEWNITIYVKIVKNDLEITKIYSLVEIYEKKLVSIDDIKTIHENYIKYNNGEYTEKIPVEVEQEVINYFKSAVSDDYNEVKVGVFYGVINGYYFIKLKTKNWYTSVIKTIQIEDYVFTYTGEPIIVWNSNM